MRMYSWLLCSGAVSINGMIGTVIRFYGLEVFGASFELNPMILIVGMEGGCALRLFVEQQK